MRPLHRLTIQYVHIPACLLKFPPPAPPPTSKPSDENPKTAEEHLDICGQKIYRKIHTDLGIRKVSKASELGLNEDSVTFLDEEDEGGANMIVCSNGNCKFLNTQFVLSMPNRDFDGEPTDEGRCILRHKEELGCKSNPDEDKDSIKKVKIDSINGF